MISSVVVSLRERRSEHGSGAAPDPDGGGGVAPRGGRCSDRLNTSRAAVGACLGSGRAKFECILYDLGGLDGSPEGRTRGGGMGMRRAMRAGVRVGFFVCVYVYAGRGLPVRVSFPR